MIIRCKVIGEHDCYNCHGEGKYIEQRIDSKGNTFYSQEIKCKSCNGKGKNSIIEYGDINQ